MAIDCIDELDMDRKKQMKLITYTHTLDLRFDPTRSSDVWRHSRQIVLPGEMRSSARHEYMIRACRASACRWMYVDITISARRVDDRMGASDDPCSTYLIIDRRR